jgi:hypothetical protein
MHNVECWEETLGVRSSYDLGFWDHDQDAVSAWIFTDFWSRLAAITHMNHLQRRVLGLLAAHHTSDDVFATILQGSWL